MGVAQEPGLQRRALLKGRPELRGRDAQGLSGGLDHVTMRAMVDPKDNRAARHAFWTNQADLDPTLRGVGEDRYSAFPRFRVALVFMNLEILNFSFPTFLCSAGSRKRGLSYCRHPRCAETTEHRTCELGDRASARSRSRAAPDRRLGCNA